MGKKPKLSLEMLKSEAVNFAQLESKHREVSLFGVTDGKVVGTYLEQNFRAWLGERYDFSAGNSAKGIDFPEIEVDVKVTSIKHPVRHHVAY